VKALFAWVNGAVSDAVKKWIAGILVLAVSFIVGWIARVNMTVVREPELRRELHASHATLDTVLAIVHDLRETGITRKEFRFYFDQHQAEHREMWKGIERANRIRVTHRDRPRYYAQYGPIPESMTDWFEVYLEDGNRPERRRDNGL